MPCPFGGRFVAPLSRRLAFACAVREPERLWEISPSATAMHCRALLRSRSSLTARSRADQAELRDLSHTVHHAEQPAREASSSSCVALCQKFHRNGIRSRTRRLYVKLGSTIQKELGPSLADASNRMGPMKLEENVSRQRYDNSTSAAGRRATIDNPATVRVQSPRLCRSYRHRMRNDRSDAD